MTSTSPFTGKWTMTSVDNMGPYLTATHATEEYRTRMMKVMEKVGVTPDMCCLDLTLDKTTASFHLHFHMKGEKDFDTGFIPLNTETELNWMDGRPVKMLLTMHTDNILMMHKKGKSYTTETTMTVIGSNMTMTMTCEGVTCTERYKKM
jgi:hypothetical protein